MKKKKEKKECWLFRYVIIHLTTARKESYRRKSERKMDYRWQLCKKSVRKSSTSSFFANLLFVFFIEEVLRIRIRKFRLDPWLGYKKLVTRMETASREAIPLILRFLGISGHSRCEVKF